MAENPNRGAFIRWLVLLHDGLMCAVAFVLGLVLSRDWSAVPDIPWGSALPYAVIFGAAAAGVMYLIGINRAIWRYASAAEILRIGIGSAVCFVLALAVNSVFDPAGLLEPRALFITAVFALLAVAGSRFVYRLLRHRRTRLRHRALEQAQVAVIGSTSFISAVVRTSHELVDCQYDVAVAFDTEGARERRMSFSVPTATNRQELARMIDERIAAGRRIDSMMIDDQLKAITPDLLREIVDLAAQHNIALAWVPDVATVRRRTVTVAPDDDLRLESLFPPPVHTRSDARLSQLIDQRTIVIVGAGSKCGTVLAERVARLRPARMLLIEANELRLHEVTTAVGRIGAAIDVVPVIGSGRDADAMVDALSLYGADYVFHLGMCARRVGAVYDPMRTVQTDLIGLTAIADLAATGGARALITGSCASAHGPWDLSALTSLWVEQDLMRRDATSPCRLIPVRLGNIITTSHGFAEHVLACLDQNKPLDLSTWNRWMTPVSPAGAAELMLQSTVFAIDEGVRGITLGPDGLEPVETVRLARWIATLAPRHPDKTLSIRDSKHTPDAAARSESTQIFAPADDPVGVSTDGLMMARPRPLPGLSLPNVVSRLEQSIDATGETDPAHVTRALSDITFAAAV